MDNIASYHVSTFEQSYASILAIDVLCKRIFWKSGRQKKSVRVSLCKGGSVPQMSNVTIERVTFQLIRSVPAANVDCRSYPIPAPTCPARLIRSWTGRSLHSTGGEKKKKSSNPPSDRQSACTCSGVINTWTSNKIGDTLAYSCSVPESWDGLARSPSGPCMKSFGTFVVKPVAAAAADDFLIAAASLLAAFHHSFLCILSSDSVFSLPPCLLACI